MTRNFDFVVVGGGLAGATAVETLRTEGAEGSILLLAAEPHRPYHRPPLSKSAIMAEQAPPPKQVLSKSRYREQGIELLLGTPVAAIDPARQTLRTRPGEAIHYARLLHAPRHGAGGGEQRRSGARIASLGLLMAWGGWAAAGAGPPPINSRRSRRRSPSPARAAPRRLGAARRPACRRSASAGRPGAPEAGSGRPCRFRRGGRPRAR